MSLFKARGEQRSMASWFSTDTSPARAVTADNAPHLAPVFAAHRHIVDYMSTLPVDAYRKDAGRRVEISLPQMLASTDAPGREGLVTWVGQAAYGLANGNAVGYIRSTDGFGYPTDVVWLHWSQWSYTERTGQWYVNGEPVAPSRILHIPWIVPPGKTLGLSPIEYYATIVRAGLSAQDYADIKRGGGIPPALLKNNRLQLDPEQARGVQSRAVESFASGKPFVTGVDWDLTALTIPPNHAQFVETLKLSANQIAAVYGIDPTEIGGSAANSLTYSTEELRQINRAANLRPYIVRIERGLARYLPLKQFIGFNVDATMRVDLKTRTEVVGAQLLDGRMSVNEARVLENRDKVVGGDFHNVPAPKAEPTTRSEGDPL